ncbi:MAG: hypothetical protein ACK5TN_19590 [Acidobacteriota bacterium]|jgi:hypothetical protein
MHGAMARRQTGPKERYRRPNYWHNQRLPKADALLPQSVEVRLRLLCIIWVKDKIVFVGALPVSHSFVARMRGQANCRFQAENSLSRWFQEKPVAASG